MRLWWFSGMIPARSDGMENFVGAYTAVYREPSIVLWPLSTATSTLRNVYRPTYTENPPGRAADSVKPRRAPSKSLTLSGG